MKRNEIINRLIQEGISEKTLVNFTDKQINNLAERIIGESMTSTVKKTVYSPSEVSAAKQKGQGFGVKDGTVTLGNDGGITVSTKEGQQEVSEKLIGKQKNIDKNHNGVIDGQDFKILKGQKKKETKEEVSKNIDAKDKKGKKCDSCGKPVDKCSCDMSHLEEKLVGKQKNIDKNHNGKIDAQDFKMLKDQKNESKPSAGLSKEKKSEIVKKAKKGEDIGKKGKGFEKIADKAAKKYGSKEKGQKVAAAAMWKGVQKEGKETQNWVKNLVENKYFHNFTSKGDIMTLIKTKLNEQSVEEAKEVLPDFLTSKAIKAATQRQNNESSPTTKPKPTTKPDTKPGKPKHNPYNPGPQPNPAPQAENAPTTKPKPTTKPGTKPGTKPKHYPFNPGPQPNPAPQAKAKAKK